MLRQAINSNIFIQMLEGVLNEFDIKLEDRYKDALSIIIPSIIFKDSKIIVLSAGINQINKLIKKEYNNKDFVSYLLALDIITHIDKYGSITIPLALLLSKLSLNREVITLKGKEVFKKSLLENATPAIILADLFSAFNIPKEILIITISVILDLFSSDVVKEFKYFSSNSIAFSGYKFSDTLKKLKQLELEKILINATLLLFISHIGVNITSSLVLVNIVTKLVEKLLTNYKVKNVKTFLK